MTRAASDSRPDIGLVASLRHSRDFERVFRQGRRRRVGGLVVITAPGPTDDTRFGVVAGRRIGPAVHRNRVKRRVRHAMRQVEAPPATDVVVIGSREVLSAGFEDLVRWLARGCAQEDSDGR